MRSAIRYSEAFKLQVLRELEERKLTVDGDAAVRAYLTSQLDEAHDFIVLTTCLWRAGKS